MQWSRKGRHFSYERRKDFLDRGIVMRGKWCFAVLQRNIIRIVRSAAPAFLAGILFFMWGSRTYALELKEESEKPEAYQLLYLNTDTFLYEEAKESSAVLRELKKQEIVVPVEYGIPWVKVSIGELTGYVKSEYVQAESPDPAVSREIAEQEAYNTELIDEMDRLLAEQKRSRIYGIIIICIIVGIFAAGIASTVVGKKNAGKEVRKEQRKNSEKSGDNGGGGMGNLAK